MMKLAPVLVAFGCLLTVSCVASSKVQDQANTTIVSARDPRAQPWSSLSACVQVASEVFPVCVSINSKSRSALELDLPIRLDALTVSVGSSNVDARWKDSELAKLDDPVLHMVKIKPSWGGGSSRTTSDFVEIWLPFGFVRNQSACSEAAEAPFDVEQLSDTAVFTVHLDGRREFTVKAAECLGGFDTDVGLERP